ncbi:MAG: hypothetical protein KKA64_01050 [Nanoarchaeota archaeon]|nr:hypothetical protein [Nanoarchaeota archaeon]
MKKGRGCFLVILIAIVFGSFLVYALQFSDTNQSDFDSGVYVNTSYNGSAVILSGNNLTGTYTSKIFDATSVAGWNNVSWVGLQSNGDINTSLAYAIHLGANTTEVFALDGIYYLADMKDSSKNFYLNFSTNLKNGDILKLYGKKNKGLSIGVYAQSDSSGTNPLATFTITSTTGEWISVTLSIASPTNAIWIGEGTGSGTDPKDEFDYIYAKTNANSNLTFQVKNCSLLNCIDGIWQSSNLSNLSLQSRYFQYRVYLTSEGAGITPQLFNVSLGYTFVDSIVPNLTINSPLNQNYSTNSILVNISAKDDNLLQSIWWYNGTANVTYLNSSYYTFSQGSNTIIAYANDSVGNVNTTKVTFFVDSVAPDIAIINPETKTYGVSTNLPLNFSASDSGIGMQSCWYNLDDAVNVSIPNCQNLTFNVSQDKEYTLNLFSNDSLGNTAKDSVTFNVLTSAPALNLNYPENNSYLSYYNNVYFNYSVFSGVGISSCQLFGDFKGILALNQTNSSITLENNFFVLNLADGNYNWGVACNDSQNRWNMVNYSFVIDTIIPNLSVTEPTGTKSSRTSVPVQWQVSDSSLDSCWYNVYRGAILEISNTTTYCSLNQSSFSVTLDADFVLNFYVNDSAGNLKSVSNSFSVSTTTSSGGGGGGGSGGGNAIIPSQEQSNIDLITSSISDIIAKPGEKKTATLSVKNLGTTFLNDCSFQSTGENAGWILGSETKSLNIGEEYDFDFEINVPSDLGSGSYSLTVSLGCKEISKKESFSVEIIEEKLGFKIVKVERTEQDKVRVVYNLKELSGKKQNVEIQFLLFDSKNERVAELKENKQIDENSEGEFESLIPINSSLKGELNLLVNLNSEEYSTFVQENIILGSPLSGFAVFGESVGGTDNLVTGVLVILFLVFGFFMIKRILKVRKVTKRRYY